MNTIDLHMHSRHSDGSLDPDELVARCKVAGLQVISLTDHDTVAHVSEVMGAARQHNVRVIPGTELSVTFQDKELHLLGYNFDPQNNALQQRLEQLKVSRITRAEKLVQVFTDLGFELKLNQLLADAYGTVGRPHVAQAVMNNPANADKLAELGVKNQGDFFAEFFAPGKPGNVPREKLPMEEGIELLHKAGGMAVWAHPAWNFRKDFERVPEVLAQLKGLGLDGVEGFYLTNTKEQTESIYAEAKRLGLFITAGGDFHRPDDPLFHQLGAWQDYGLETDFSKLFS